MELVKRFFPAILRDNEETYFASMRGVLESVDELCSVEIIKTPTSYRFRIAPSLPMYTNLLIEEILKFHNLLGIRLDMGKSIKSSAVITFQVILN